MIEEQITIEPQPGFQYDFLSSPADIVIGGGAAGAGKTFAILLDALRSTQVKGYNAVIFRRTTPMIRNLGGLWDTSESFYPYVGGVQKSTTLEWSFPPYGTKVKFSHIEYEKNILDHQGAQYAFIGFDELTHFTEKMFFYLLSRNRSTCGVRPYVRATCNPDPDSWVAEFISWWIDQETGFPIEDRAGVLRFFIKDGDNTIWGSSIDEVRKKASYLFSSPALKGKDPSHFIKSVTFIPGNINENAILLEKDPAYLGNLLSQDEATKAQLLEGNWKVKIDDTEIIPYQKLKDAFTNSFVGTKKDEKSGKTVVDPNLKKYITADIALHGSDLFVVFVWLGFRLTRVEIIKKSDAHEVEKELKMIAEEEGVSRSRIAYDAVGVGAFLRGYLKGAVAFNGALPQIDEKKNTEKNKADNKVFKNLRAQCAFRFAEKIIDDEVFLDEKVVNVPLKIRGKTKTIKQWIMEERKAMKRDKADTDQKLMLIPKDKMKAILNGRSPDFMDAAYMRMIFEIKPKKKLVYHVL